MTPGTWISDPGQAAVKLRRTGFALDTRNYRRLQVLHAYRRRDKMAIQLAFGSKSTRLRTAVVQHPRVGMLTWSAVRTSDLAVIEGALTSAICGCLDCTAELRGYCKEERE